MKYILITIMFTTILGCGWIKKIDNTLNKNIKDSISLKIDTTKEYKQKFNYLSKHDSLSIIKPKKFDISRIVPNYVK